MKSNKHEKQMGTEPTEKVSSTADHGKVVGLEAGVLHFMNVSIQFKNTAMEEREKSQGLVEELAATTKKKHDAEQRLQQLNEELDDAKAGAQATNAAIAGSHNTIANLNANLGSLRRKVQEQEAELKGLRANVKQCTKANDELEDRLHMARTENAQEIQRSTKLNQELDNLREDFQSQRSSNTTLQQTLKQAQEQRDEMHKLKTSSDTRLKRAAETQSTLSDLVKRRTADLEGVKAFAKKQTEQAQQDLSVRQCEIKALTDAKTHLTNKNKQLETALSTSRTANAIEKKNGDMKFGHLQEENKSLHQSLEAERERLQQEKKDAVDALSKEIEQLKKRHVRAVAICVDFSGSVSGSDLTEGVRRFYAHLLDHIERAACNIRVMVVVHGPCGVARVKTEFWDPWQSHKAALVDERTDGSEAYVACIHKVQDATLNNGSFLSDLQVVLIGDGDAFGDSSVDTQSICQQLTSRESPVPIHSVVVQQGKTTGRPEPDQQLGWFFRKPYWHTWDYSIQTQGKELYWGQDGPLPDLGDFLL